MSLENIMKELAEVDRIQELDTLLLARDGARRVYAFLGDAFITTQNAVFLDYQDIVLGAGQMINEELNRLAIKMSTERGSDRFKEVGKTHDKAK